MYLVTVKRRVNFHKFLVVNSITLSIVSKCMEVLARLSQNKFNSTNNIKRMIQLEQSLVLQVYSLDTPKAFHSFYGPEPSDQSQRFQYSEVPNCLNLDY